jgi:hypothetical protein
MIKRICVNVYIYILTLLIHMHGIRKKCHVHIPLPVTSRSAQHYSCIKYEQSSLISIIMIINILK